eukprot:4255801-Pleurochrysis_carterae.AAC.6
MAFYPSSCILAQIFRVYFDHAASFLYVFSFFVLLAAEIGFALIHVFPVFAAPMLCCAGPSWESQFRVAYNAVDLVGAALERLGYLPDEAFCSAMKDRRIRAGPVLLEKWIAFVAGEASVDRSTQHGQPR